MAEGGQQNQQQAVYHITIYTAQNQREIVQTRTTEIAAGEIGQINISQAAEQQNVGQHQPAGNVQPNNIAEGIDALNLSQKNTEASETGAIEKKDDRKLQDIPKESARERMVQQKQRPLPSLNTAKGGNNTLKSSMLRSRATALIGQTKFDKAATLLEELAKLQKCTELDTALMMVECYLQLGREKQGEKAIDDVRLAIMASVVADDVKTLAIDLISNSAYIRAIILLRIASDIYKARTRTPDDVINWIKLCVRKIHDATRSLIGAGGRSKIIGVDYGIEYMTEMLDDIRAIENADPVNKAIQEAWCLNYIGSNYNPAGEKEKSIKILKNGLEVLEKQFGSNASKYQIYGLLLHNIGVGYYVLQKYEEAESYYIKAIGANQKASDYENEAEKQEKIEYTKTELKKTRAINLISASHIHNKL
uniref:uncharacterized protein LOC120329731 n=1 Tax=Styela clava TaxID=7725 RepID=UPI00193A1CC6|nr:uncharacterized protein LOC120329731 [Styela clava]